MKVLFLFVLTMSFYPILGKASPESRCRITHCLCKVSGSVGRNSIPQTRSFRNIIPTENSRSDLKNTCDSKRLTVYFEHDKSSLNTNDRIDISKFIQANSFAGGFYLEGHASSSGNVSYNQLLSQRRTQTVAGKIRQSLRRPIRMKAESYGERYANNQDSSDDRKVTITPIHNFIALLDLKKTDYYLIDQSGSMQKYWSQIQDYKFHSRQVQAYLSTVNFCQNGSRINSIDAYGGTHVWYSFWNLIDQMRPGSSVTIVSDFQTPVPLNAREWSRIKAKLNSKNIKLSDVHFIQIEGAPVFHQITE